MRSIILFTGILFFMHMTRAQIPATYDLRNVNGNNYVTSVKNQQGGTCWTHGTMAAMEGNLYMTGAWADAGETGEPALAEYHLDWWNGYNDYFNADLEPPLNNGQGLEVHQGGDYRVSTAYLSRGDGAVREIDGQSYNSAPAFYEPSYHKYYPLDVEWYVLGENFENMELIKTKVMEEGVMATCMCYSSSFINGQYEHYQPVSSSAEPNHSVSIIGWDDNREIAGAPGDGAWLVKNSWGSGWGNSGYFWISYYDKHACQNPEMGAISFQDVIPMPYDDVYYHDYHGWRDTLTGASEAFNKYIANDNSTVSAVSFFTAAENVTFEISIYDEFDGSALSGLLSSETGSIQYSGLHTIGLTTPVDLTTGDDFYVHLYVSDGGIAYDRTSDVPVLLGGGTKTIVTSTAALDESYYWNESKGWDDFYYYDDPSGFQNSGNFCIKALTQTVYAIDLGLPGIQDPSGNNNGQADPGETIYLVLTITNGGLYEATGILGTYTSSDPYISISSVSVGFSDLEPGESAEATVELDISDITPIGHTVEGDFSIVCLSNGSVFTYDFEVQFKVGLIFEDFETGDFSAFDWTFGGNADWEITDEDPFEGTFSAVSGAIGDQQESVLSIAMEVNTDDIIAFYRRVSTETGYDYLRFLVDGNELGAWAGEESWELVSFNVDAGLHTFTWVYEKDYSVASGDDCAWIDFVVFPATEQGPPPTFDLRSFNGQNYVTSVKSQQGGTCWTHGTMAALEGNLLMTGTWAANGESGEPALAEYHLDWWNGFNSYYNADLNPPLNNGQGLEVHQGGDYRVTTAYISRGDGTVREIDGQSYTNPPVYQDTSFHIYYPMDVEWFILGENFENMDLMKAKIMMEGVMATCMCYSGNFINNQYEHYQPVSSSLDPNHSVAIVGWDDDRVVEGAPGSGAWLCKNSWGDGWGIDGYFWISYYDKHAGQHPEMGAVTFKDAILFPYNHVYYHDYHGWRDTKTDITSAFNAFEMEANGSLEAISFFTAAHDVSFQAVIYDDFNGVTLSGELTGISGIINYSGLHTIMLEEPVVMETGDDFYVFLELEEGGHPYDRTSIVPVLLCGQETNTLVPSTANPGESYYFDGNEWVDFYYYDDPSGYQNTGNFCIKAIANIDLGVGLAEVPSGTEGYQLRAYPNPFVDAIEISYSMPGTEEVSISILDITGNEIFSTLIPGKQKGTFSFNWTGTTGQGASVKPGVYFCRMYAGHKAVVTKKIIKVQ